MNNLRIIHYLALVLVIVGAINWGLVGLFNVNLVSQLFGTVPMLEKLTYILIGASGIVLALTKLMNVHSNPR